MHFLSKQKIANLKQEYKNLLASLLLENEDQVKTGGPMDSFKEAAAYSVSKQAKESKVKELKQLLENVKELAEYVSGKTIILGKYFSLKNSYISRRYRLVDPAESDPSLNLISNESPLGKAIITKKKGYKFEINKDTFEIIDIE